jgi:hypothetical protein
MRAITTHAPANPWMNVGVSFEITWAGARTRAMVNDNRKGNDGDLHAS